MAPRNRSELIRLLDRALELWVGGAVKAASPAEAVLQALTEAGLVIVPGEASAEMADAAGEALKTYRMFGSGPHASTQVAIACVGYLAMLESGRVDMPGR